VKRKLITFYLLTILICIPAMVFAEKEVSSPAVAEVPAAPEEVGSAAIDCSIKFTLKGWSAFYKTADGDGRVSCSNGQHADVLIHFRGGGVSFGTMDIFDGEANFAGARDIDEIFGGYVAAEAHAGAVKSVQAAAYTKGNISFALSDSAGRGVNLGFDFGRLEIARDTKQ